MSGLQNRYAPSFRDDCQTPGWLYEALDREFSFDLDPCPLGGAGGLELDWDGRRVFCNPPYSNILVWVEKAFRSKALTVFVLPARWNARWSILLLDGGAEARVFRKSFTFERADGRRVKPFPRVMVWIVRRFEISILK